MSVLHLFIAILAVLAVSIVLTVVNWIFQARISSRIMALEKELEKKTLAFDTLRKEKAAAQAQPKEVPLVEDASALEMPVQQQTVDDGAIQIVRNVRGTFSTTRTAIPTHKGDVAAEEHAESTQVDEPAPVMIRKDGSAVPLSQAQYRARQPQGEGEEPTGIVIPVYSEEARGPDLNRLYNSLIAALQTRQDPLVTFDLSGIQSMSAAELDYLEKILWSLSSRNRSLFFVNCSPQLALMLQHHPQLAGRIR